MTSLTPWKPPSLTTYHLTFLVDEPANIRIALHFLFVLKYVKIHNFEGFMQGFLRGIVGGIMFMKFNLFNFASSYIP